MDFVKSIGAKLRYARFAPMHPAKMSLSKIIFGEHGAELRAVSGLFGHTNISTTLRYAMATDPLKVSAIGAIPRL